MFDMGVAIVAATQAPIGVGQQDLSLGGMLAVTERDETFDGLRQFGLACVLPERKRAAVREEEPGSVRIVGRPEFDCGAVGARC